MKAFRVSVHITPRKGLLDPQGKAVEGALHSLGFGTVREVHVGRHIVIENEAADADEASMAEAEVGVDLSGVVCCALVVADDALVRTTAARARNPKPQELKRKCLNFFILLP